MVDRAVVVFSGVTELPVLRCLKAGFRHCFVVLNRGGAWVVVEPLAHCMTVDLAPGSLARSADEIAALYRAHGLTAVVVDVLSAPHRLAPLRLYTCVEVVKRLIGRRAARAFTPWQLYRLLREEKNFL